LLDRHVTNTYSKKIVKFVEAFWRAFFYAAFCILGYFSLFSPDTVLWITDPSQNWRNWPFHKITPAILFYYQIELGCYFHQLMWTDRNHSDALEMMIHHIVTISLIIISHLANFFRVGAIILLIHDISDVFLETAKVLNYTAKPASHNWLKVVVDIVFAIFAVLFFITRLVIYPGFVLTSMFTDGYQEFGISWLGAYVYVGLLLALQALHIFWFYLISRMIYKLVFDKIEKDERSDDETEDVIILKSDGKKTN
jgi:ceramide synthetase